MKIPTIKGVFVNSRIKALRKMKGKEGVKVLQEEAGKKISCACLQNMPVSGVPEIIPDNSIPLAMPPFEADRLHFRDFTGPVFKSVKFISERKDDYVIV